MHGWGTLLAFRASMTGFVVFDHETDFAEAERAIADWIADGSVVARETVVDGGVEASHPMGVSPLHQFQNMRERKDPV